MKRILYMALALILSLCLFAVPALAAGTGASLTGPGTVRAGDTVTLTLSIEGSGICFVSGSLEYDNAQLELQKTERIISNGWTGSFDGNAFLIWDDTLEHPIESKTGIFTLTFKVKANVATGTAVQVCVKDLSVSDGNKDTALADATYSVSIAAPLSGDNALKSLTVSNATISPAFSAGTTSYTAEVPFAVNKLNVSATANDSKATVSVSNPELTAGGITNVTVTVTAENGSAKTYTIVVLREADPNAQEPTEPPTEPATEPSTAPATEPSTEPSTAPSTEPESQPSDPTPAPAAPQGASDGHVCSGVPWWSLLIVGAVALTAGIFIDLKSIIALFRNK